MKGTESLVCVSAIEGRNNHSALSWSITTTKAASLASPRILAGTERNAPAPPHNRARHVREGDWRQREAVLGSSNTVAAKPPASPSASGRAHAGSPAVGNIATPFSVEPWDKRRPILRRPHSALLYFSSRDL